MKRSRTNTRTGPRGQRSRRPVALDLRHDAEDLHAALSDLLRLYQFRDRKRICCHDISVTQCHALDAIWREGSMALAELAAALYLDKSTACRVVDSLEQKGYTVRKPDPEDGRCVRIALTARGRTLRWRIEEDLIEETRILLADFDPEVRRATTGLIARLAREARTRFSRVDGGCCKQK